MKPITMKMHGYLDYATVLVFLLAPGLLGLEGLSALVSWVLAGVHLIVTLVTHFPLALYPWLPFRVHGWIEKSVGPVLVLIAFLPGFAASFAFYLFMGLLLVAVAWLTDYSEGPTRGLDASR
ncbi:conserved membrane protein of unknown function (plasmid) [Candidatus Methylocalor cossyra]|uniref:Uncharacterized protein n=2 Tax=Candidatus Methylocalor cossyra TaxID=3108543 RepID=A0ABP1CDL2_9GAMM